jgi:hypothetical protein
LREFRIATIWFVWKNRGKCASLFYLSGSIYWDRMSP